MHAVTDAVSIEIDGRQQSTMTPRALFPSTTCKISHIRCYGNLQDFDMPMLPKARNSFAQALAEVGTIQELLAADTTA